MGSGGEMAKKTIRAGAGGLIFDLLMRGIFIGLGALAVGFSAYEWMWVE